MFWASGVIEGHFSEEFWAFVLLLGDAVSGWVLAGTNTPLGPTHLETVKAHKALLNIVIDLSIRFLNHQC